MKNLNRLSHYAESPPDASVCSSEPELVRMKGLQHLTGLAASTIYDLVRREAFPAPIRIQSTRSSAWVMKEVRAWLVIQLAAPRELQKRGGGRKKKHHDGTPDTNTDVRREAAVEKLLQTIG